MDLLTKRKEHKMTKENKIVKPGWKDRLKANWKKLAMAVAGVVGVVYYILTGSDIDLSFLTNWLQ